MKSTADIYEGKNPIELPAYTVGEAARCVQVATATVRAWVLGRPYPTQAGTRHWKPIIEVADRRENRLSFRNLLEVHVLSAIRKRHRVKIDAVRKAIDFLRRELGCTHPLADQQMHTDGTDLFVERYGQLMSASAQGQMAMKEILGRYLERIERDVKGVPIRLYPFTTTRIEDERDSVVIDPRVQFGRPCLKGTGIPTSIIAERYKAGDSIAELAKDYDRRSDEIEEALRYEHRAA